MQRRRFKNTLTFPDRLAKEADRFCHEAESKPPGQERDDLLRKARQAETAAHIDEWLSSPGSRPPCVEPSRGSDTHAYRAYLVGPDGHIVNRVDLFVGDDASAKERARGLVDRAPVELWDGDRKIAEFKPRPARDLVRQVAEEYANDQREIIKKLGGVN